MNAARMRRSSSRDRSCVRSAFLRRELHHFASRHMNLVDVGSFAALQFGHRRGGTSRHVVELREVNPLGVERDGRIGNRLLLVNRHQQFIAAIGEQQPQFRTGRVGLMQASLIEMVDSEVLLRIRPWHADIDDRVVVSHSLVRRDVRRRISLRIPWSNRGKLRVTLIDVSDEFRFCRDHRIVNSQRRDTPLKGNTNGDHDRSDHHEEAQSAPRHH